MLAYIFWHYRHPHVDKNTYHKRLIDFHETLQANKPGGFLYSAVFQIAGAPWIADSAEAYEDWYIVENSAALDILNEAAVNSQRKSVHDLVAHDAAKGAGGLYRLHSGDGDLAKAQVALWFAKPTGMSYETLYSTLEPEIQRAGASLWRRQMVLGPAHEFCLSVSSNGSTFPFQPGRPRLEEYTGQSQNSQGFFALRVPLTPLWRGTNFGWHRKQATGVSKKNDMTCSICTRLEAE